jgi:opacity protein-like surface antigen
MLHQLKIKITVYTLFTFLFIVSSNVYAQHRGDNISFQGLTTQNDAGVKATAMGSAVTSLLGDVSSIFYNPAGLMGVKKLQVSVSANSYNAYWRENQHYRPNRFFVTLPFYLEGLYIPNPADNGLFDHERLWTENQQIDSSYIVDLPDLGLDPFSEEAADWTKENDQFAFNNAAVAFPFSIGENNFVVSAAYNRKYNVEDFDRNDTYLDPHIGFLGYGDIGRVNGVDTLVVDWSRYERMRSGPIDNVTAAIAYDLHEYVKLGIGFQSNWGETKDFQSLTQVGTFDLIRENRFRFSYVDSYDEYKGISKFTSTTINIGFIFNFEKINVGLNVDLPYTIERDWSYTLTSTDSNGTGITETSGIDKVEMPAVFNFGISFQPVSNLTAAVDYEYAPFSQAKFKLQNEDPTQRNYVDRHTLRVGLEYMPVDFLSILAGYRNIPSTFVPDGSAEIDNGPDANSITGGLSIHTFIGRFDLAYEYRSLRYYDSYYSNTNYVSQSYSSLMFGFLFSL